MTKHLSTTTCSHIQMNEYRDRVVMPMASQKCGRLISSGIKMRGKNEILFPEKTIGSLSGIDVGYQFYSRAEMTADGFHIHWLNGIDYIGQYKGKKETRFDWAWC